MVRYPRRTEADDCPIGFSEAQELWLGPGPFGSVFPDREALCTAWAMAREYMMKRWGSHGRRPSAFYELEYTGPRPAYAVERSTLWRTGVLSDSEKVEVEREWKAAFMESRRMGAREGRAHLAHCDVPSELIEAWTAARRRRAKANPTAAAQEEAAVSGGGPGT
jgi:hypothetical protein